MHFSTYKETHCERISLEGEMLTEGTSDKAECNILEQGCLGL